MKISLKSIVNTTNPLYSLFEDNKYLFIMGRNICIKQFSKQNYTFLQLHQQTESVLDMKVSSNRKSIIVAEIINDTELYVSLYYFKSERKTLKISNKPVTFIKLLPGINQSSYLNIWINYGEDNHLMQIDINKMKIVANAYTQDHIYCIQNHLISNDMISVTGRSFLKIYQIVDGGFQLIAEPSKKISSRQYNVHCWFDNFILIAGSGHQLLIFNNDGLIHTFSNAFDVTQQITNIIKINKSFIATSNLGKCFMFIQQEQNKFIPYQQWWIEKQDQKNAKIESIYINNNEDLIVIRTQQLNFYISKILQIESEPGDQYSEKLNFHLVDEKIKSIHPKGFSFSETKDLGLFIDPKNYTFTIYNIFPTKCILRKQFTPKYKQDKANILISGALHPSGYSMVLSFGDRIRFYHLLLDDIKPFYQLTYNKVKGFKYSQGGHLLSFFSGKPKNYTICIFNTITMTQLCNLRTSNDILNMSWIKNDSELMCTHLESISIWKTSQNFKQQYQIKINQNINNAYFDDKSYHIIVSTMDSIIQVQNLKIINRLKPRIPDFDFILPFAQKYLISDLKGNIYISNTLQFLKYDKLCVSHGRAQIFYKHFNLIYFNENYSELCLLNYHHVQKMSQDDYVLVVKSQIEKNIQKVKGVESLLESYQSEILNKLEQEKNKFETIQQTNTKKFRKELEHIQKNYSQLLTEKLKIQKTSRVFFEEREGEHIKAVDSLEILYDNKLELLQNKILNLQDKLLEQRTISKKRLVQLQKKYQQDISQVRKQYEQNMKKTIQQSKGINNKQIVSKRQIEEKFNDLEQENELMVLDLQIQSESIIKDLKFKLFQSDQNSKYLKQANQNLNDEILYQKRLLQQKCKSYQQLEKKLQESKNRIKHVEKQVNLKVDMLKQKQIYIQQLLQKINVVEKTKGILFFRTTQMRKQLEPKQTYIQKLKIELSKLSNELDMETRQKYQLKQKAQRQKKIATILNAQLNQYKTKLKKSNHIYGQIIHQINRIISTIDPKQWNAEFVKFYHRYIKSKKEGGQNKKGVDQNTIEEMNRHLIHVQHSLYQNTVSNQQALKGKQKQITRKFKENAELIQELNELRKREKILKDEMQVKNIQLSKLKKELAMTPRHSKRIQSAGTTVITRKTLQQQPINLQSVDSSFRVLHQTRKSQYNSTTQSRPRTSNRILSANRPIIFKGNNYDPNTISLMQRSKIYELNLELEVSQNKLKAQDKIIDELNKKIMMIEFEGKNDQK